MKEEKLLNEKLALVEKELATFTACLEKIDAALKDVKDLKREIKGLKLFLGRAHPEFKGQYLEIMKKIKG